MTHLYLIRHGQAMNVVQHTIGNTGLSPLGVRQAESLRERLAASREIQADVLIASTMLRAKETAEIIAPALQLPIVFDDDVQEWRDGGGEDLSEDEYREAFEAVQLDQKPFFRIAPDAESWAEFMLRAITALNRISQEYEGKKIVIVCHGGVIEASLLYFQGLPIMQLPRAFFATHNTSITHWLRGSFADLPVTWILERYNDTMHLRDLNTAAKIPWGEIAARPVLGDDRVVIPTEAEQTQESQPAS
jgi:probable phosphoglycerate mutase